MDKTIKQYFSFAYHGDKEQIKLLLNESIDDVNMTDKHGWTAIHYAVIQKHEDLVDYLISIGIDVDKQEKINGWSPLHIAAIKESLNIVKSLIKAGCNRSIKDHYGDTAMDCIASMPSEKKNSFIRVFNDQEEKVISLDKEEEKKTSNSESIENENEEIYSSDTEEEEKEK